MPTPSSESFQNPATVIFKDNPNENGDAIDALIADAQKDGNVVQITHQVRNGIVRLAFSLVPDDISITSYKLGTVEIPSNIEQNIIEINREIHDAIREYNTGSDGRR